MAPHVAARCTPSIALEPLDLLRGVSLPPHLGRFPATCYLYRSMRPVELAHRLGGAERLEEGTDRSAEGDGGSMDFG